MQSIRTAGISFFLFFPILTAQHSVAADDANAPAPYNARDSDVFLVSMANYETGESSDEDIRRLFGLYLDAQFSGMTQEADALAKQIVLVSIRSFGRDSKDTARALTNLANLQASNDQNSAAIQNYAAAIDIVERVENSLSMDLVNPLNAMGAAQLQAGHGDRARDAWTRAVHISHVNLGPHNYRQIETLEALADLFSSADMNKETKKIRRRIEYLQYRYANPEEPGMLPAVYNETK